MNHRRKRYKLCCLVILACLRVWPASGSSTAQGGLADRVQETRSGVEITTAACLLSIRPLTASAVRIRCAKQNVAETPSIVLIQQQSVPAFKVIKSETSITVETEKMMVIFGRRDGALQFADSRGKTFLSEIAGTRVLDAGNRTRNVDLYCRTGLPYPTRGALIWERRVPGWIP